MKPVNSKTVIWLRIAAGLTALLCFGLVVLKIYAVTVLESHARTPAFSFGLMLFFPFSVGLFFAYMAIKGKMPFLSDHPRDPDNK